MSHDHLPDSSLRQRMLCAAGALLTTTGLVASMLGAFGQLAFDPWLAPTPEVLALAAQCEARPSRPARTDCLRQVVARRVTPGAADIRLARVGSSDR